MKFDISGRGLTTLKDVDFPENLTTLDCGFNHLTSLEHCPSSTTVLYCGGNLLTSLEHCPSSVTVLWCDSNQLISLEYCPSALSALWCSRNQLTSLEHCPSSLTELYCYNNPLNDEYKDLTIKEIHKLNRKKSFLKGLDIVQKIIQDFKARKIQNMWQRWWYDELDDEGISRYCQRTVADFEDKSLLFFNIV